MSKQLFLAGITLIFAGLALYGCGKEPSGNHFSADMILLEGQDTVTNKLYVGDAAYRMEQGEGDRAVFVIADEKSGSTFVFRPSMKQYMQISSQDPVSLMNDPFQSCAYVSSMAEELFDGTDTVAGYACDKYLYQKDGKDLMTKWVSEKFAQPLKIVVHVDQGKSMELADITEGPLDAALFEIPDGYEKITRPGEGPPEAPDWSDQITSAPVIKPPYRGELSAGEVLRVEVEEEKGVKISGESIADSASSITGAAFRDGRPTKDISFATFNLSQKGQSTALSFEESPREADEIIIRVNQGSLELQVEHFETGPSEAVAAGEEFRAPVESGKYANVRVVNMISGESLCKISLLKDGAELGPDVVGPDSVRTVTLNKQFEVTKRSYSTKADEVLVTVEKGEMLVNFRQ
ncbi:MAG: hypothetical protein JSU69_05210 [Candidatus Zixiibacteriota bacterium]|nr:MAG: hypothetical protein JSU69_05210 [candidate division Zixibacteria bacterium]